MKSKMTSEQLIGRAASNGYEIVAHSNGEATLSHIASGQKVDRFESIYAASTFAWCAWAGKNLL